MVIGFIGIGIAILISILSIGLTYGSIFNLINRNCSNGINITLIKLNLLTLNSINCDAFIPISDLLFNFINGMTISPSISNGYPIIPYLTVPTNTIINFNFITIAMVIPTLSDFINGNLFNSISMFITIALYCDPIPLPTRAITNSIASLLIVIIIIIVVIIIITICHIIIISYI